MCAVCWCHPLFMVVWCRMAHVVSHILRKPGLGVMHPSLSTQMGCMTKQPPPTRPLPVNRHPEDMLGAQDASCLRYTAQEAKGPICHLCPNAQISVMRGLKSTWEPSPYRWRVCISHKLWQMWEHLQRLTGIKTVQSERLRECRCLLYFHLILIKHVWSAVRCIRRLFRSIKANTHGNKYRTRNCLSVYI